MAWRCVRGRGVELVRLLEPIGRGRAIVAVGAGVSAVQDRSETIFRHVRRHEVTDATSALIIWRDLFPRSSSRRCSRGLRPWPRSPDRARRRSAPWARCPGWMTSGFRPALRNVLHFRLWRLFLLQMRLQALSAQGRDRGAKAASNSNLHRVPTSCLASYRAAGSRSLRVAHRIAAAAWRRRRRPPGLTRTAMRAPNRPAYC